MTLTCCVAGSGVRDLHVAILRARLAWMVSEDEKVGVVCVGVCVCARAHMISKLIDACWDEAFALADDYMQTAMETEIDCRANHYTLSYVALAVTIESVSSGLKRADYGFDAPAALRPFFAKPSALMAHHFHCEHCTLHPLRRAYDRVAFVSEEDVRDFVEDYAVLVSKFLPPRIMHAFSLTQG